MSPNIVDSGDFFQSNLVKILGYICFEVFLTTILFFQNLLKEFHSSVLKVIKIQNLDVSNHCVLFHFTI